MPPSALASNPVIFIQNLGQFDERALFQVRSGDRTVWLAKDAIWVTAFAQGSAEAEEGGDAGTEGAASPSHPRAPDPLPLHDPDSLPTRGVAIRLSFPGANPHPRLEPFGRLETSVNYFIGSDPEKWQTNVPVWAGVRYADLYPGIDLELTGEGGHLVPRLVARPGADLGTVRLRVEGADEVTVEGGHLRLTTAVGAFILPLLAVEGWGAEQAGVERADRSTFDIVHPFATGDAVIGGLPSPVGAAGASDLLYATFLGGSGCEGCETSGGIAVDGGGNAYVMGRTDSPDFPTTPGAFDRTYNGGVDAFVVKLAMGPTRPTYIFPIYISYLPGKQ